jgi:hypothetical protein
MVEAFGKLNGGEILGLCGIVLGLVAILCGLAFGFATLIAVHRRRVQLDEMEATLKMEMIQRGMSAGEIKQVLESRMWAAQRPSPAERFAEMRTRAQVIPGGPAQKN